MCVIPYQINKKNSLLSQISLKIGTHVWSIGKPQNLAYFDYSPLRFDLALAELYTG